jgi:hypothetical protein
VELLEMLDAGRLALAILYLGVSLAAGLAGVQAATIAGRSAGTA